MTWIREIDEPPARRSADIAKLVVALASFVVVGVWAHAQTEVDASFFAPLNSLTDHLEGVAKAVYALGSPWAILVVALAVLALRLVDVAWRSALVGLLAWGGAVLVQDLLAPHDTTTLAVDVRVGDGPEFPATNVAIATGLLLALSPYLARPFRRLLGIVVLAVATTTMYLGAGLPSDVLGGLLLGLAASALVAAVAGTTSGKPSIAEVRDALVDLGYDPTEVRRSSLALDDAAAMDVVLGDGDELHVDAYGRDQRETQLAARVWHRAMYREPGSTVLGSRAQRLEHVAYAMLLAQRAGVQVPELLATGMGGPEAAVILVRAPHGTAIADLAVDEVTDDVLRATWSALHRLHGAGVNHGHIDLQRLRVTPDGAVALDDFAAAGVNADSYWTNRDGVALLVATALLVGHERAIAAGVAVLGNERMGSLIPVIQPAALPPTVGHGVKHLGKDLKALRALLAEATGVEDAPPLQIKRLTAANIGILAGVLLALAIAIPSLQGIDWQSLQGEFEDATWGFALLALVLWPIVPMSWATALLGCVNAELRFVPTVLVQLACSFLNLITPNGIGGTALQLDYLHKQGVPLASGGSAMVLSTGVGGAIQVVLFLIAAAITATAVDTSSGGSSSTSLWVIAIVAALIGIVLAIPKIRGKVVPAVTRAATDIWAVIRNPHKALQLFGGDTMGNLIYPALLGLCLLAFGESLGFAQLMVVQIGAGMLGNVAPVPGGIGVQEAALTAGLTSFGVDTNTALATVIVFRGITFALPPVFGFVTLRWLRTKGYV